MSNTETIKIQHGSEIELRPPDEDNEIMLTCFLQIEELSVFMTKTQAQQLINTLQAFIS